MRGERGLPLSPHAPLSPKSNEGSIWDALTANCDAVRPAGPVVFFGFAKAKHQKRLKSYRASHIGGLLLPKKNLSEG